MLLLILGLLLWTAAHLLKRLAPDARQALTARFGEGGSKGVVAGAIGLGVLLMIVGYRMADFTNVYTTPSWTVHLNNLMMLGSVALFGMGSSKGRARTWLRHPMLTGVLVWALAHLIVNGDLASVVLFGWLALWSVGEMALINAKTGPWDRPEPGPASGDVRLVIISVVVFVVIGLIHGWLGYWPFGG